MSIQFTEGKAIITNSDFNVKNIKFEVKKPEGKDAKILIYYDHNGMRYSIFVYCNEIYQAFEYVSEEGAFGGKIKEIDIRHISIYHGETTSEVFKIMEKITDHIHENFDNIQKEYKSFHPLPPIKKGKQTIEQDYIFFEPIKSSMKNDIRSLKIKLFVDQAPEKNIQTKFLDSSIEEEELQTKEYKNKIKQIKQKKGEKYYYKHKDEFEFEFVPKELKIANSNDLRQHLLSRQRVSFCFSVGRMWRMNEKIGCGMYTPEVIIHDREPKTKQQKSMMTFLKKDSRKKIIVCSSDEEDSEEEEI